METEQSTDIPTEDPDDTASLEMPRYLSHRQIWALQIARLLPADDGSHWIITPVEEGYAPFDVSNDYISKYMPIEGGHYVVDDYGTKSFLPTEMLEAGYVSLADGFGMGEAIRQLELGDGRRVTRRGWNGPDQWLELQTPDENSKMKKPYIYISPVDDELVPWAASQTDLLAHDWLLV